MRRGIATILLFVALATISSTSLAPDEGLTKKFEQALKLNDEFAIAVSHIKPKKKSAQSAGGVGSNDIETFFAAEYTNSKTKFVLMIDMRKKRVIVETVDDKEGRREHIVADSLNFDHHHQQQPHHQSGLLFKSIVMLVKNSKVEVYIDCVRQGEINLPKSINSLMALHSKHSKLQVYRERRYRTKIYFGGTEEIEKALKDRENCYNTAATGMTLIELEHGLSHDDKNRKFNDSFTRVRRRGDIPGEFPPLVDPNGCYTDELMAKTLNLLIDAIKKMWIKLDLNLAETKKVRELLENCAGCKEKPTPPPPPPRSCRYNSPCYPGADCRDTPSGPVCLRCPSGYHGDGRNCRRHPSCSDNPCFEGVDCTDTPNGGYTCGACPRGYTGNGQHCERFNGCQPNPCFPSVPCNQIHVAPYFRCGGCPSGYNGNGLNCHREDECDLAKPCWQGVRCHKYDTGYRCDPCPDGMTGNVSEGRGVQYALDHRQYCYRIDPCADDNGGCVDNSDCFNSEVTCT